MQKKTFRNEKGLAIGFVLHRVNLSASKCKVSAWYDAEGNLKDAERTDSKSRTYRVREDSELFSDLDKLGKIYLLSKDS